MASADLLLHPVRLRIVKAFLGDRALTTGQLAEEMPDVPAGTLYRHVATLTKAGTLQVVAERRVRGAVERTYTLRLQAARIGPGEVAEMTGEDLSRAFTAFTAGLLADFDRYLATGDPDPIGDGFSFNAAAMWLTDAEYRDFLRDVATAIQPRLANPPAKNRARRMLFSIFMPSPEAASTTKSRPGPNVTGRTAPRPKATRTANPKAARTTNPKAAQQVKPKGGTPARA